MYQVEHFQVDEDVRGIDNNKVLIQNIFDVDQKNIHHVFYHKIMNDVEDHQVMFSDNFQVLIEGFRNVNH
jgi:hypothetical protein